MESTIPNTESPPGSRGRTDDFNRWKISIQNQIQRCDVEITASLNEISEYETLKVRLVDLPKKLSHQVLVPFGNVGFMRGRLVNTNKVTVLYGDNYFVDRSCFQACQIIDRRIAHIRERISRFEIEKKQALSSLELGNSVFGSTGETVEIREEYDEQTEREWRKKRAKRTTATSPSSQQDTLNFERTEKSDSTPSDAEMSEAKTESAVPQTVASSAEGIETARSPASVPEKEKRLPRGSVRFSVDVASPQDEPKQFVNAEPRFSAPPPRSILRNIAERSPVDEDAVAKADAPEQRPLVPSTKKAFTGFVVERAAPLAVDEAPNAAARASDTHEGPTERVSRFKLSRSGLTSD